MAKGGRCFDAKDGEGREMRATDTVLGIIRKRGMRHWRAEYSERRLLGSEEGRRKSAGVNR